MANLQVKPVRFTLRAMVNGEGNCGMGELDRDVWPWLSPSDKEWTWQDGHWHTLLRELIRALTPKTLDDLNGEIAMFTKHRQRHVAAKNYEELSSELLTVLATLRVITGLRGNLRVMIGQLMLEARERGASWGDLGWAMEMSRQAARDAYPADGDQYGPRYLFPWLSYDVEAARRVAYEIAQDPEASDEDLERANAFLELADTPEHRERLRKEGRTPPRRYV
jgi:hypothetical protein